MSDAGLTMKTTYMNYQVTDCLLLTAIAVVINANILYLYTFNN